MSEEIFINEGLSKEEKYLALIPQLRALTTGEHDVVANCANIVAALKETFSFFWVGVYFVKGNNGKEELVLGPFQGPPACVRISKGKGLCGTAWEQKETVVVPDVTLFPGHIACSPHSKSEIVVPVFVRNEVKAVIDVDSNVIADFDSTDQKFLEEVAGIISLSL